MNIRGFFTKKRTIWTIIILLVVSFIGYRIFRPKDNSANIQTDTVKKQDLKLTVLATGEVVSQTDLSLSFKSSGVVYRVNVKEGDKVTAGTVLANLDGKNQLASLTSARGALAQAQANYNKVLSGASNEDIAVAQVTLDNAKSNLAATIQQQETAVKNAYSALLNTSFTAVANSGNIGSASITVSGTYTGNDQGVYKVMAYNTGSAQHFQVEGLESADGEIKTTPVALGVKGLYIQFSGTPYPSDFWTITIPNTLSSTYTTNYNAYQAAVKTHDSAIATAQNTVNSAQATLDLKRAQARPADLDAANAQILSAQGQVQAAQAALSDTLIIAPANGTITSVDTKVGELATALKEAVILQDVSNLHVEADVSEANISTLKPDQSVDITFDALGPDRHFTGKVQTVNPGATVVSGVVNYKVTASIDNIPGIKPGMTANMTVLVDQKDGVLAMPQRGVISKDGKKYVRVVDDTKKKTYHEVEVQTGLQADGGLVEILSGVSEGQEVVTFVKQ
ncbi:MAG TPA: efflux RND transporter periplasmic adaptor subunit [Candidatus Limnocylindria bacterium]|nr:efflux RND transporter periplasmic adaptor subunit [Candidatus Limnocylindria bacterium]